MENYSQDDNSLSPDVSRAIGMLKSLHDGDQGVLETVRLGSRAIPALRAVLFERDPSGLFHTRTRAVDALVTLSAYDVLAEFLRLDRQITDPVERVGEEVVVNAAARGVARSRQEWAFKLLFDLARRCRWSGVIAAVGSFRRPETVPLLVDALIEDEVRMSVEAALKVIGRPAMTALIDAANQHLPSLAYESESSLRRRRSALSLLIEMGVPKKLWPGLRTLLDDPDTQIALLACKLCLDSAIKREWPAASARLRRLRPQANWIEQAQIDSYLAQLN